MAIAASFPTIRPSLLLDFANSGVLDPRITFSRSTTATYYDGVTTAKAEENLLRYSQEFDVTTNGWTPVDSAVTANSTTAPDGTNTADTFTASAGTGTAPRILSTANVAGSLLVHVASFFVKAGTNDYVQIANSAGTAWHCNFDVNAGSVGTSNNCTGTITSFGSGWYRCSVVYTPTNAADISARLYLVSSSSAVRGETWNPVGTETVYLWGAQLEQRSAVTAYTPTTTQPITNYIPVLQTAAANVARFDHNPTTGKALGLLIEEQRTNLLTYSEDFADASWPATRASIITNTIIAPDGTLTGDKFVEDGTASTTHFISRSGAPLAVGDRTLSIYAKAAERSQIAFIGSNSAGGGGGTVIFDASTGTVVSNSNPSRITTSVVAVGNGWYRFSASFNTTVAAQALSILLASSGSVTYTGDGYSGIYIWGAQLEVGAFPTSYIATTSATVTRNADAASMTGTNFSSWYNAGEGTVYSEWTTTPINSYDTGPYNFNSGGSRILVAFSYLGKVAASIPLLDNLATSVPTSTFVKIAHAIQQNNFAASANGLSVVSSTSANTELYNVTQLTLGRYFSATDLKRLNGHIRKIAYYPQRLTDANLQALTA